MKNCCSGEFSDDWISVFVEQGYETQEFFDLFEELKDNAIADPSFYPEHDPSEEKTEESGARVPDMLVLHYIPSRLYKLEYPLGKTLESLVGKISRKLLLGAGVYVLDTFSELHLWIGKESTLTDRDHGRELLARVLLQRSRPQFVNVKRYVQGGEGWEFKIQFDDWEVAPTSVGPIDSFVRPKLQIGRVKADVDALFAEPMGVDENDRSENKDRIPDSVEKIQRFVWTRRGFKLVESLASTGHDGVWANRKEAYIFLITFRPQSNGVGSIDDAQECYHVIYFWRGRECSGMARSTFEFSTREGLETAMREKGMDVRMVYAEEGREPPELIGAWDWWVTANGPPMAAVGEGNMMENLSRLFHIQWTRSGALKVVETEPKSQFLVSRDIFVLQSMGKSFTWIGKGVSRSERQKFDEFLPSFLSVLGMKTEFTCVEEKREPEEFWTMLGGKVEYGKGTEFHFMKTPRVFRMHCLMGYFLVEEVFGLTQMDLLAEGCVMIDPGAPTPVFLWIGGRCTNTVLEFSRKSVESFFQYWKDGRSMFGGRRRKGREGDVIMVEQGMEDPSFHSYFHGWIDGK